MITDYILINGQYLKTDIAITAEEKARGFMNNESPGILCFPYAKSAVRKFWMRDTPAALDIIFCNKNKILTVCHGSPYSLAHIGPESPTDLIIEMPYQHHAKYGFLPNKEVEICYSLQTLAKKYSMLQI